MSEHRDVLVTIISAEVVLLLLVFVAITNESLITDNKLLVLLASALSVVVGPILVRGLLFLKRVISR